MSSDFSRCLSLLRQEKGISQRAAAKDLGISQALLSHYENGVREPGLAFVTKACNYYNVSADFLLGRTLSRDGTTIAAEELYDYSTEKDNVLHGSIMATLNKKLLVNSIGVLFDLLGKTGRKEAINAAADYLGTAVYKMFRHLYRADGSKNEDFFSVPARQFMAGVATSIWRSTPTPPTAIPAARVFTIIQRARKAYVLQKFCNRILIIQTNPTSSSPTTTR